MAAHHINMTVRVNVTVRVDTAPFEDSAKRGKTILKQAVGNGLRSVSNPVREDEGLVWVGSPQVED